MPPAIQSNLGIRDLISQVEAMYRAFISKEWKPIALDRLTPVIKIVRLELDKLGPLPQRLTIKQVMLAVHQQLNFEQMALELTDPATPKSWTIRANRERLKEPGSIPLRRLAQCMTQHPPGSLGEAAQLKGIASTALKAIDGWLQEASYFKVVAQALHAAFEVNTPCSSSALLVSKRRSSTRACSVQSRRSAFGTK